MKKYLFGVALIILFAACQSDNTPLPILGHKDIVEKTVNGQVVKDTIYHTIPNFKFTNQYGKAVTPATFEDKIYVSDFFFTSCPTICPTVKAQMHRIYEKYQNDDRLLMLSHTLDPKRDNVEKLHKYAKKLQLEGDKWNFVTGDKEELYDMAMKYLVAASEDADAPGGITHSGKIVLIDKQKRIRTYADGTEAKQVTQLLKDIDKLLNEEF